MTNFQKRYLEQLTEMNFNPIHLFGSIYLVRTYPRNVKRIAPYIPIRIPNPECYVDNVPGVPKGEFRI